MQGQTGPIWHDGQLVAWDEAMLHVLSHGLNYASSVFEGERVYAGQVFKLTEHTARLIESARLLGIAMPYSLDELCEATKLVVATKQVRNGYVRPVVWKGNEEIGISSTKASTHIAIAVLECEEIMPPAVRAAGVRLMTSSWARPAPHTAPIKAKAACNYAIGGLAAAEARAAGFDDALMLDYRGEIAESTGSNFFFVKDGVLHTPIPDCALDGITRQTVIDLARQQGLEVVEGHYVIADALAAQEAYLTGTAVEILPIKSINAVEFSAPRTVTEMITQEYFQLVGKEVFVQV